MWLNIYIFDIYLMFVGGGLHFCSLGVSSKCKFEVKSEVPNFPFSMSIFIFMKTSQGALI